MTVGVSAPTAPRVAIVGVRRLRQGLGVHFARWLVAAGAEVPAFIGRTPESIDEGRRLLLAHGVDARGFTSLDALLAAEPVEALVIASPAETHAEWLQRSLDAGLHVLCEKPLVWGGPGPAAIAQGLARSFWERGLLLDEHCQWPHTLPAFLRLHPEVDAEPLREFGMELSPSTRGEDALVDTLSHPVSVVQALLRRTSRWVRWGDSPRIASLRFSTRDPAAERLTVEADLSDGSGAPWFRMTLRLSTTPEQPRPAAIEINGRRADRRIRLPGYEMSFADGARSVPLEDPMRLAVAAFVRALASRPVPLGNPSLLAERMQAVAEIVAAFRGEAGH